MKNKNYNDGLETIVITGASGFIGEHLLDILKEKYHIHAFARRTQKEVGIPQHKNIIWDLVDITDKKQLTYTFNQIKSRHNIEYIIHLAAYYDFSDQYKITDTYEQTNILGTKYILEIAKEYKVKHFIFASSLVASKFPPKDDLVYEGSELDADFPYAITKRKGEELVQEYSKHFKCSIVRFAAVFSDCCNYEPLYNFMTTWLSKSWKSRMIAGQGRMAIPYIHINCITDILYKVIERTDSLPKLNIFLASSDKPISLLELFLRSTKLYTGVEKKPIFVPVFLSKIWVIIRDMFGRLVGKRPFERYWMLKYIDQEYHTDCAYTKQILEWEPNNRHQIDRRLIYLIENLKNNPHEWHRKNRARLTRFLNQRPSLILVEEMHNIHDAIVKSVVNTISLPGLSMQYRYYQKLPIEQLKWYIDVTYNNLLTSVRHGDRAIMINFGRDLAKARFNEGVTEMELCSALKLIKSTITSELYKLPRLQDVKLLVNDYIALPIQLAIDEILDTYDLLKRK
jgi:nucleoside-diphosphate-sugar epimerase